MDELILEVDINTGDDAGYFLLMMECDKYPVYPELIDLVLTKRLALWLHPDDVEYMLDGY